MRIKGVFKKENSETDDVKSEKGMDEIKNTTAVLEALPPMIVREVGNLFCQMYILVYVKSSAYCM